MVLIWLVAALAADGTTGACVFRSDLPRLTTTLTDLEASWTALDEGTFLKNVDQLRFQLPCAAEVLPPELAARTHRALALDVWVRGEEDQAVEALLAARTLDPSWVAPPGWLPDQLAVRVAEAPPPVGSTRARHPHEGMLAFDGTPTDRRPDRTSVLQWVGDDGTVLGSWVLGHRDPLPDYDPVYHSRRNLVVASLTGLALGGALYGGAFVSASGFPETRDLQAVRAVQTRTNTLTAGGVALMALGVSGFSVALAVGR